MVSLMCELQFWTMKDDVFIKDSDLGCFKLHDKGDTDLEETYLDAKEEYAKARDVMWTPSNRRPERLRDSIKEFEDILGTQKCISLKWITSGLLQLFFQSGACAFLQVEPDNCKLQRVSIDRYLVGKLASEHVSDAMLESRCLLVAYYEPKMTYVCFSKSLTGSEGVRKLSSVDPKVVTFDVLGLTGRRLERKLSLNSLKDWVLTWWSVGEGEVWPWMPSASNRERSNMVVYALNGPNVELLTYGRVDKTPVLAHFSQYQSNKLLTVEEDSSRGGSIAVDVCVYELAKGKFERVSMTSISLQGRVVTSQWNNAEDKLILLCDDASLVLYDAVRQTTHFTRTSFVGVDITWHPGGSVVFFASEEGQLQCFDTALSTIQLKLAGELSNPTSSLNIGSYVRHRPILSYLSWQTSGDSLRLPASSATNCAALLFDSGPLAVLKLPLGLLTRGQLGPLELVSQYLKHTQVDEAICLLLSLDWGRLAEQCFLCLSKVANFLLRKPLDSNREAQLEAALGSFYGPAQPIPDLVVAEYGERVGHLARRFFHHLLRFEKLEKAFLLAVDLGCRDLFLDLHHLATRKGENALMEVALRRANALKPNRVLSDCDSADFNDSSSELTDDCCSSDEGNGARCTIPGISPVQTMPPPNFSGCRPRAHTNLTSASSHSLPGQHSTTSVPNVSSGGGSASYRWPPSKAVPVTRAPEEDLIDLSDDYEDYEFTSDGIRLSVPVGVHHALPPRTVAAVVTTPTQRSVIRPIPRIVRHPPEHLETAQSLVADVYNHGAETGPAVPRRENGLAIAPPTVEEQSEEILQGQTIQCVHFGVV
ncbi:WD repeat-containing and planar cell polarity effector protein fritz homolog isoform X1 [Ixodes scapularis]|uniref:WD repeat-containing and planar cell polarity effector protein fritz homolog isoform X1 n=1 Tax=Ixodes scapularis TaxID=6945 RepID=UPI001A9D479D|nr:WD repeat-containing and planar cell polarity effector protein fritz homolog isoform X1 [Ixodes scapularis]